MPCAQHAIVFGYVPRGVVLVEQHHPYGSIDPRCASALIGVGAMGGAALLANEGYRSRCYGRIAAPTELPIREDTR